MIFTFEGMTPRIHPSAWIAPTAVVIGNVEIAADASIWFGAVVRGDQRDHPIRIGRRANVQDNAVVHVSYRGPTIIEEDATLGHGVVVESCEIARGALIGMNSVVLQRAVVGEQAIVGAGSVVGAGKQIPARHLATGNPAEVRKEIGEASLRQFAGTPQRYVALSRRYMNETALGEVEWPA